MVSPLAFRKQSIIWPLKHGLTGSPSKDRLNHTQPSSESHNFWPWALAGRWRWRAKPGLAVLLHIGPSRHKLASSPAEIQYLLQHLPYTEASPHWLPLQLWVRWELTSPTMEPQISLCITQAAKPWMGTTNMWDFLYAISIYRDGIFPRILSAKCP